MKSEWMNEYGLHIGILSRPGLSDKIYDSIMKENKVQGYRWGQPGPTYPPAPVHLTSGLPGPKSEILHVPKYFLLWHVSGWMLVIATFDVLLVLFSWQIILQDLPQESSPVGDFFWLLPAQKQEKEVHTSKARCFIQIQSCQKLDFVFFQNWPTGRQPFMTAAIISPLMVVQLPIFQKPV